MSSKPRKHKRRIRNSAVMGQLQAVVQGHLAQLTTVAAEHRLLKSRHALLHAVTLASSALCQLLAPPQSPAPADAALDAGAAPRLASTLQALDAAAAQLLLAPCPAPSGAGASGGATTTQVGGAAGGGGGGAAGEVVAKGAGSSQASLDSAMTSSEARGSGTPPRRRACGGPRGAAEGGADDHWQASSRACKGSPPRRERPVRMEGGQRQQHEPHPGPMRGDGDDEEEEGEGEGEGEGKEEEENTGGAATGLEALALALPPPPPPGPPHGGAPFAAATGCPPSELLESVAAAARGPRDRASFVELWRSGVMSLGVMLRQLQLGVASREADIQAALRPMLTELLGSFHSKPWGMEVVICDLSTGVVCEPPHETWHRVVAAIELTPAQLLLTSLAHEWWSSTAATLQAQRRQLAERALTHPEDPGLQSEVIDGLEQLQSTHMILCSSLSALLFTALLTPAQGAEIMVQSWPYIPTLLGFLHACNKLHLASSQEPQAPAAGAKPRPAARAAANGRAQRA